MIIGHFWYESFQSITCTDTDNLTRTTKRQNIHITQNSTSQKLKLGNSTTDSLNKTWNISKYVNIISLNAFSTSSQETERVYSFNRAARTRLTIMHIPKHHQIIARSQHISSLQMLQWFSAVSPSVDKYSLPLSSTTSPSCTWSKFSLRYP